MDKPIINSLLYTDLYKFTMGNFIHKRYPKVRGAFELICRDKELALAREIDIDSVREQLDHVRSLRITNSERQYLAGLMLEDGKIVSKKSREWYQTRVLSNSYTNYLKTFKLPEYNLYEDNGNIKMRVEGSWLDVSMWETYVMTILASMHTLSKPGVGGGIPSIGFDRLNSKIDILKNHPDIKIMEFGTRRCAHPDWQHYVLHRLVSECPDNILGTSNVYLTMKLGISPMGTMAHELQMMMMGIIISGASQSNLRYELRSIDNRIMGEWEQMYPYDLRVFLPDTFSTIRTLEGISARRLFDWKGIRIDSMDPELGARIYKDRLNDLEIPVEDKLVVPSDGLTIESIIKMHSNIRSTGLNPVYGWGSSLSNDVGLKNLRIVYKPVESCGVKVCKLSDNPNKHTGDPDAISIMKAAYDYNGIGREVMY
jgi:nicotinate phosphoribosyltransferase